MNDLGATTGIEHRGLGRRALALKVPPAFAAMAAAGPAVTFTMR